MENVNLHLYQNRYSSKLISEFLNQSAGLAAIIRAHGIQIKQDSRTSIEHLKQIDVEKLEACIHQLRQNIGIFKNSIINHKSTNNKSSVKNILDHMRLSAPNDFINKITEQDVVEIYNIEGIQIFRNLKFYETTSYSLADLLTYEWFELFYRPKKITEKLMSLAEGVMKSTSNDTVYEMNDVPIHYIKEIKADPIQLCQIKFKYIAPVTDSNKNPAGVIVSCEATSMSDVIDHRDLDFI